MARGSRAGRTRALLMALAAVLVAGVVVVAVDLRRTQHGRTARPVVVAGATLRSALGGTGRNRPNIVFVLTDDLSNNLLQYMPHVQALEQSGMRFTNYTVTDSLCCPSRSSIFSGRFPHNTGVFTNDGPDGGFHLFHDRHEETHTFATALQQAGYRTALLGKYLNGYSPSAPAGPPGFGHYSALANWVPPGWDRWAVAGWGYGEYDYLLNENHTVHHYGSAPDDYMTNVLQRVGQDFITSSAKAHQPFMMELATFSPHWPYTPAAQDRNSFPGLKAPRGPSFDRKPNNAPAWLAALPKLTRGNIRSIDQSYRERVESVQSVDRAIAALQLTLARTGQLSNTVFVFNSDNGYHMGEHGMSNGKLTAFDTDVNVPLIIAGPGIRAGSVNRNLVQNIDLAPTFEKIAGTTVPSDVDGRSMVPLLTGKGGVPWRTEALIEHHGNDFNVKDPDYQTRVSGNPPSYEALRTATFTYVRYRDGEREYYDRRTDPHENNNIYDTLSPMMKLTLSLRVDRLHKCRGGRQCWSAGMVSAGPATP